ncbi:TPA: hypothetical protein NKO30_006568 [Pseudomonas aeruginosa]|nr:hypothetical protein [Pseudomonas aeruginosa]
MNVEIRAHRILKKLKSYTGVGESNESPVGSVRNFGLCVGRYSNPLPDGRIIHVLKKGVAWENDGVLIEVPYRQIATVCICQDKGAETLDLYMKDGSILVMPVAGREGRFSDAMAMIQFLDRVLADMSK